MLYKLFTSKIISLPVILLAIILFPTNCFSQSDMIHWNNQYKLKWTDFAATAETSLDAAALTAATISYKSYYVNDSLKFKVDCYFTRSKSWTKDNNDTLLKHEQGHFDITEIFARKLRKELSEIPEAKVSSNAIDRIFKNIMAEKKRMQNLYDSETNSSLNRSEQSRWEQLISDELKKLGKYIN